MAALVGAATACAFMPAIGNGFVNFDDDRLLLHNPYLRLPWPQKLAWMGSTTHMGHYQPLTWLSLSLDQAVAGLAPMAYHVDSLFLHAVCALLVYSLLVTLLTRAPVTRTSDRSRLRICAAVGALFWSIHPLRVESVAWVAERRDPLSLLFWLLALTCYLKSVDVGRAELRSRRWYVASCVMLALSLLSKAWGMSFFLTLVVLDWYPLGRLPLTRAALTDRRYRPVWLQKLPYALLGIVAGAVAWVAQHNARDTMVTLDEWGLPARVGQAAYGLVFYVWKTIWPTGLAALYELPRTTAQWPITQFACLALVAGVVIAVVLWGRRVPALSAALIAYAVTVAPVLGFAQSGPQLVADRYSYVSSLPFSALVAGGLLMLPRTGHAARAAAVAVAACLLAFAVLAWRQTTVWHDSERLWAHALSTGHPGYTAHLNYGQALRASGRIDDAIAEYRQALAIRPDAGNAWYNLGNALKASRRDREAEQAYLTAIPHLQWKVDAQVNLGNLFFAQHRIGEAIEQYRAATATLDRGVAADFSPEPYLYLGMALSDGGDRDGARRALDVALRYPATRRRAQQELDRLDSKAGPSG